MKNIDNEIINKVSDLLKTKEGAIVVIPHSNPDGDAIGSAYGLALILQNAGKKVKIVTPNDYPSFLQWLNGEVSIINFLKNKILAESYIKTCELMFCVDFNEISRVDEMEQIVGAFSGTRILIDHHPKPTHFCDLEISDPTYSSSAELVYDFIRAIKLTEHMDRRVAEALYTGIMTDTGSFSYGTSRPGLYGVLQAIIGYGIDTEKIHSLIYDSFSADRFRLLGYCLQNKMVILQEFRSAYISITRDELKMFNFKPGDTEGFVNIPLSIDNIIFSALFIEKENIVKASFRSKGKFPANLFSELHFNGGGHLNASGGETKLGLVETTSLFTQLLPGYLHLLKEVE